MSTRGTVSTYSRPELVTQQVRIAPDHVLDTKLRLLHIVTLVCYPTVLEIRP